jgi:uncharacterized membrane protein YesL
MANFLALILVIVFSFVIVRGSTFLLKRSVKFREKLLERVPMSIIRVIAAFVAMVFGGIFLFQMTYTGRYNLIFLIISVLALVFSLRKLQDEEK